MAGRVKQQPLRLLTVFSSNSVVSTQPVLFAECRRNIRATKLHKNLIIPSLKIMAVRRTQAKLGVSSLTASQIGYIAPVAVVCNSLEPGKWQGYSILPTDYSAIISPSVDQSATTDTEEKWEECPSFPNIQGLVRRPKTVSLSYYNERNEDVEEQAEGFRARVLLHEIEHMQGITLFHTLSTAWRLRLVGATNPRFDALAENCRQVILSVARAHLDDSDDDEDAQAAEVRLEAAICSSFSKDTSMRMAASLIQVLKESKMVEAK